MISENYIPDISAKLSYIPGLHGSIFSFDLHRHGGREPAVVFVQSDKNFFTFSKIELVHAYEHVIILLNFFRKKEFFFQHFVIYKKI